MEVRCERFPGEIEGVGVFEIAEASWINQLLTLLTDL
jgi:hypothetical protein